MTRGGDDGDEMSIEPGEDNAATDPTVPFDDPTQSDVLVHFLADLRAFGDGPAPVPSGDLAAVFDGALPLAPALRRRGQVTGRHRHRAALVAAVSVGVLSVTGVAAATGGLPGPAQQYVSRIVNDLNPFRVDSPHTTPPVVATTPGEPSDGTPDDPPDSGAQSPPSSEPGDGASTGEDGSGAGGSRGAEPGDGAEGSTTPSGSRGSGGGEDSAIRPGSAAPTRTGDGGGDGGGGGDGASSARPAPTASGGGDG